MSVPFRSLQRLFRSSADFGSQSLCSLLENDAPPPEFIALITPHLAKVSSSLSARFIDANPAAWLSVATLCNRAAHQNTTPARRNTFYCLKNGALLGALERGATAVMTPLPNDTSHPIALQCGRYFTLAHDHTKRVIARAQEAGCLTSGEREQFNDRRLLRIDWHNAEDRLNELFASWRQQTRYPTHSGQQIPSLADRA